MIKFNTCLFLVQSIMNLSWMMVNAQSFEGRIIYAQTFESYTPQFSADDISQYMGSNHHYYVKNDKYISVTNGIGATNMMYSGKDNFFDVYAVATDSLSKIDASIAANELKGHTVTGKTIQILGRKCIEIVFEYSDSKMYYYYDPTIKVDYQDYKNHKYSYWNEYIKQTNSLPLKYVLKHKEFSVTGIATDVQELELDDSFFSVENLKKLSKSMHPNSSN